MSELVRVCLRESVCVCVCVCVSAREGGGNPVYSFLPMGGPESLFIQHFFQDWSDFIFSPKKNFFQSIFHLSVSYECGQVSLQGPHVPIKVSN